MTRPYVLGLTGGIGTGKSTVSFLLKEKGALIIDADEISRHALDIGTSCYRETVNVFGNRILNEDTSINRKELAGIVFNHAEELKKLNAIIHPYVRETIYAQTENAALAHCKIVVWDIPLLVEGNYQKEVDSLIVVTCPIEKRLERLEKRSGFSREDSLARMRAQMSDEDRCRFASFVIDNGGTLEELMEKVEAVFSALPVNKDAG